MQEIWKPVEEVDGQLEVSSLGNVRSIDRVITVHDHARTYQKPVRGRTRKLNRNVQTGYMQVAFAGRTYSVHRLVANAFIPNPQGKPQVNHKNFDRSDNRVENLEWCTDGENTIHSMNSGHHKALSPVISLTTGKEYRDIADAARDLHSCAANIGRSCKANGELSVSGQRFVYLSFAENSPQLYAETAERLSEPVSEMEWRKRSNEKRMKPVAAMQGDEIVAIYSSIRDAAKATGACPQNISNALAGRRASAAGFSWRFSCAAEVAGR